MTLRKRPSTKHLATDNFALWSPLTGDPMPAGIKDVNGPADLTAKSDIIRYLKGSFALGRCVPPHVRHYAAIEQAELTERNIMRRTFLFFALVLMPAALPGSGPRSSAQAAETTRPLTSVFGHLT